MNINYDFKSDASLGLALQLNEQDCSIQGYITKGGYDDLEMGLTLALNVKKDSPSIYKTKSHAKIAMGCIEENLLRQQICAWKCIRENL